MPLYIETIKPPSKQDFNFFVKQGYRGNYKDYLALKTGLGSSGTVFLHGELGEHCADCNGVGENLCDYPVGDGKTCDRSMCEDHCVEIGPNIHYCKAHYALWDEFKKSGGVSEHLKNVIAFKAEK